MPDAPRLLSHVRPFQTVKGPKCCQRNCHLADAEECDRRLLELIVTQYRQELLTVSDIAAKVSEGIILVTQRAQPIPYHTSILSGQGWVEELLNGHPERI